jgi:hypothetical protein
MKANHTVKTAFQKEVIKGDVSSHSVGGAWDTPASGCEVHRGLEQEGVNRSIKRIGLC